MVLSPSPPPSFPSSLIFLCFSFKLEEMEGGIIQTIVAASITLLTVLLIVIGVWLVLILKDIRKLTGGATRIINNVEEFTAKLNEPANFVSGLVQGLEKGIEVIALIKKFFTQKPKDGGERKNK